MRFAIHILGLWGVLLLVRGDVQAQYPRNFSLSNYSGVAGAQWNPANLADSRHRFALVPFAISTEATNNFINVRTPYSQWHALRGKVSEEFIDENGIPVFENSFVEDRLNDKRKQVYFNANVTLPSFTLGLKNRGGIGFSTRTRAFVSMNNLDEDLLKIFLEDFDTTYPGWSPNRHQIDRIGLQKDQQKFGIGALAYQEFALSYATVLIDDKKNFLKGGATYKYLIGLGATYLTINNLNYKLLAVDSIQLNAADMNLAYIGEEYYTSSDRRLNDYLGKNKLGQGSAIDIGVVYEYRPNFKDYQYRMDKKRVVDHTVNKYLFKFGASIVDFGQIRFNNTEYARQINVYSDTIRNWDNFKSVKSIGGSEDIDSFIFELFPKSDSTNSFNANLPTSLNLMFDYRIAPDWYVGSTWVQSLRGNKVSGVRKQNVISFGARYETRKFEAGANLVFGQFYNPILLGMHLRLGPVYIGSDNLGGILTPKATNGIQFFVGVQLPILHNRIPDMDGDMVSDKKDECPNEFGSESAKGCPDMDGDRVPDKEDRCPEDPGDKATYGCPDEDLDGLVGSDDKCPDIAGLAEFQGCPDTDGDGVADHLDQCPDVFGEKELEGCPKVEEEVVEVEEIIPEKVVEAKIEEVKPEPIIPVKPKPDKPLTPGEVIDYMEFGIYDYYLILGVYENKLLADALVKRLNREAGVLTYIYFDESNNLNYVTFGRATGEELARSQLSNLDKPSVNNLINGHVWWKKVPK